jgi:hypothetical protein
MVSKRTPINRGTRTHLTQEAVDAWLAGDVWGLQNALNLKPWHHGVLPPDYAIGYALPEEPDGGDESARGWARCKRYQAELIALVGLPPISVKRAVAEKRLAEAQESLEYLKTAMAKNLRSETSHEKRLQAAEATVVALRESLP